LQIAPSGVGKQARRKKERKREREITENHKNRKGKMRARGK
jgi:hypothetical protein